MEPRGALTMAGRKKKTLRVEKHPKLMYWLLKWDGGGELPAKLTGFFQTANEAQRQADLYEATR